MFALPLDVRAGGQQKEAAEAGSRETNGGGSLGSPSTSMQVLSEEPCGRAGGGAGPTAGREI